MVKVEISKSEEFEDLTSASFQSYQDIIKAIGFNDEDNVFSFEKKAELTNFQRFLGYSGFSSIIFLMFFGVSIPWYIIPIMVGISLSEYKNNDHDLMKIFSFAIPSLKNKSNLLKRVTAYKNEVSNNILSNTKNQNIILKFLDSYQTEHKYMLPNQFYKLLDNLKNAFHLKNYLESLDILHNINKYIK